MDILQATSSNMAVEITHKSTCPPSPLTLARRLPAGHIGEVVPMLRAENSKQQSNVLSFKWCEDKGSLLLSRIKL